MVMELQTSNLSYLKRTDTIKFMEIFHRLKTTILRDTTIQL